MPYSSNPLNEATNNDGLEIFLTNVDKKPADVSGLDSRLPFRGVRSLAVHALLLFLASMFFALWIDAIETSCPLDPLLTYSPVNEAVQYVQNQFDASINSTSVFRGYPSPAIDAAWRRVSLDGKVLFQIVYVVLTASTVKATRLTREQFLMVGGNDSTAVVKYRPQDGGGYMSQVDGYHHLHCLDMLRKYLRRDYYAPFDPSFNSKLRPHLGHCVEIIRQKLMCTSDLTMINYDWVPGLDDPRPNLNAMHQCVDHERILDWSDKHNAHVLKGHVVQFGDATELPEEPM